MSEKITKFIEDIKSLSVLELNELVETIQEEFGVSAVVATSNVGSTDNTVTAKTAAADLRTGLFLSESSVIPTISGGAIIKVKPQINAPAETAPRSTSRISQ